MIELSVGHAIKQAWNCASVNHAENLIAKSILIGRVVVQDATTKIGKMIPRGDERVTELELRKSLNIAKTERDEARNASEAAHAAQASLRDEIKILRRQLSIAFEMLENVCAQIKVIEDCDAVRDEEPSLRDDMVKFRRRVLDEFAFLKAEVPRDAEGLDGLIAELTDGLLAERF